jgi:hypothetical protein
MELHDLLPWDDEVLQRLSLAKVELARASQRIRLATLLASLPDPGDAVLTFSCSAGSIRLLPDGSFEVSASDD